MRRFLTSAAFLLIISLVPVCAQRGGGHASGGSHGGFSGGHAAIGGGHASFGGSHAGFGGPVVAAHGAVGRGFGGSRVASRYSGSHYASGLHSFGRSDHFRHGRYGYGYRNGWGYPGYGYPYYGYYAGIDPYWWWDSYSSYNEDDARERDEAAQMNAENLDEQQSLREQDQDAYARPMGRPRPQAQTSERADADPPTVLVFRDQHKLEIHNYAIVGQMLWSFGPQRTEKIPLANLDLPATEKANDERGVEFRVPRVSEGQ